MIIESSLKLQAYAMASPLALVAYRSSSHSCTFSVRDLLLSFIFHTILIPRPPAPIAWPIAKLLDHVLGKSDLHTYKKAELKSFLQFHRTGKEPLRDDEISILNGVLELNSKRVETIMTPMKVC
jgi:CBS domain containing-hemolysin-like protein